MSDRKLVVPTEAPAAVPVLLELISETGETDWLELADGDLTLGTANRCDLRLTGGPALHSVIHRQGGTSGSRRRTRPAAWRLTAGRSDGSRSGMATG